MYEKQLYNYAVQLFDEQFIQLGFDDDVIFDGPGDDGTGNPPP